MSASASRGRLALATRQLLAQWDETRLAWRDQKADDFEKAYLAELRTSLDSALRAMEELDHLLEKVHADCD